MRPRDVEAWALRVLDQINQGGRVEDTLVECKFQSDPEDAPRIARRLAGLCNAARGEPVLWLIGIKEDDGTRQDVTIDFAHWWSRVQARFDEIAPNPVNINVVTSGHTLLAIAFETDRAPFVVKHPDNDQKVSRDVPWRDGTSVRSIKRNELFRILTLKSSMPCIEFIHGFLKFEFQYDPACGIIQEEADAIKEINAVLSLYFVGDMKNWSVFPNHKTEASLEIEGCPNLSARRVSFGIRGLPMGVDSPFVKASENEVAVLGPGMVSLSTTFKDEVLPNVNFDARYTLNIQGVEDEHKATLQVLFKRKQKARSAMCAEYLWR